MLWYRIGNIRNRDHSVHTIYIYIHIYYNCDLVCIANQSIHYISVNSLPCLYLHAFTVYVHAKQAMCRNVVFWPGWTATCRTGSWMDNFRIREQMNHKSSFMYIYVIRSSLAEFLACGISSRSLLPSIPMSCVAGWSCPFRPFIMRFSDTVEKQLHLHILHSTRPLLGFFFNFFFHGRNWGGWVGS